MTSLKIAILKQTWYHKIRKLITLLPFDGGWPFTTLFDLFVGVALACVNFTSNCLMIKL